MASQDLGFTGGCYCGTTRFLAFSMEEGQRLQEELQVDSVQRRKAPGSVGFWAPFCQVIASSREKLEADVTASREALAKAGPRGPGGASSGLLLLFGEIRAGVVAGGGR